METGLLLAKLELAIAKLICLPTDSNYHDCHDCGTATFWHNLGVCDQFYLIDYEYVSIGAEL